MKGWIDEAATPRKPQDRMKPVAEGGLVSQWRAGFQRMVGQRRTEAAKEGPPRVGPSMEVWPLGVPRSRPVRRRMLGARRGR